MGGSKNPRRIKLDNSDQSNSKTRPFLFVFAVLFLATIACGPINPLYQRNNEVRLAVFAYESAKRGPVKDLVIHFRRDEPHIRFDRQSQNGGDTVWLYPAAAQEFFATRPQTDSYLYIQEIKFGEDQQSATVSVYRGDGSGYQGWQLTVIRQANSQWVVTAEEELEEEPVK